MLAANCCASVTLTPSCRAISGYRRLPNDSMWSRTISYSRDFSRPARSNWSMRHSRRSRAPTPGGWKLCTTFSAVSSSSSGMPVEKESSLSPDWRYPWSSMLPTSSSAIWRRRPSRSQVRTWSSSSDWSEASAVSESNMNCRRSSSSGVERFTVFAAEKWSRHSWSSWSSFWRSASNWSTGSLSGFSVAGSYWVSAGGSCGSSWAAASSDRESFSSCVVSVTDTSSSIGFCWSSCSTIAFSSSTGACSSASDCWSCGDSTICCDMRCDR